MRVVCAVAMYGVVRSRRPYPREYLISLAPLLKGSASRQCTITCALSHAKCECRKMAKHRHSDRRPK